MNNFNDQERPPPLQIGGCQIYVGDCRTLLKSLADKSIHTCVTSPPYYRLRNYDMEKQIGQEQSPAVFVAELVAVFREVRRALRDDGTLWLNLGDSYAQAGGRGEQGSTSQRAGRSNVLAQERQGSTRPPDGLKAKDLIGIPWRVALALQADGWYLRQDIIWHKPNPMPESVTDRCTKAHEYIFLLSKNERYYFDHEAIREPAVKGHAGSSFNTGKTAEHQLGRSGEADRVDDGKRNRRSVWTVATKPYKGAHFATFPADLIEPCVLAGAPRGGVVLDPFFGSGTTGAVAQRHGRKSIGLELNPKYAKLAVERVGAVCEEQREETASLL